MATQAHTLVVSNRATSIASTARKPVNDTFIAWTHEPRAKLLLASCVASPPKGAWHETRYVQSRDLYFGYVGYRAEALDAIRMAHGDRALQHYHATGTYEPFRHWCSEPTATDAIDAALNSALDAAREG